uniref:Cadherin domain-containing protein n=1 Tax=Seriola lalandi dorsalis TaxID=1841481 RepID=A0A3B4YBE4_SERLL
MRVLILDLSLDWCSEHKHLWTVYVYDEVQTLVPKLCIQTAFTRCSVICRPISGGGCFFKRPFQNIVTTTDEDAGSNAISRYSITDTSLPFNINSNTGDITISRPLNREDTDHYIVKVSAHDSGWTVSTDVTIFITDINDNAPRFSRPSYYLDYPELTEVGSMVTQVSATDPDEGFNGKIFYFIRSQSEYFRINASTGEIFVKQQLKYQNSTGASSININRHSFIVTASDRAVKPMMSETTVIVNIVDSNDNPPEFDPPDYFTPVTKSVKVGTKLIRVVAQDKKDFGLNSEVEYVITSGNSSSKFKLDKTSGWITIYVTGTLDREKEEKISLRVLAKNAGSIRGADIDEVFVNITILDANDPPVFTQELYDVQVSEGLSPGGLVTFVSAEDSDSVPSWSRFSYSIAPEFDKNVFTINPKTGQVSVAAELDRETTPVYNLTVLAVDTGTPPATGSATVIVNLEDINDNGPTLTTAYAEVMENQRAGTAVTTLTASDPDLPPNQGPFLYSLLSSGSANSYFSLSPAGVLTTSREIDREQISDFYLSVVIKDSGVPQMSSTGTIHVKINDQNDNPSEPRSMEIFVHYFGNMFPGGSLGDVKPQDPDIQDRFHCSLIPPSSGLFSAAGHFRWSELRSALDTVMHCSVVRGPSNQREQKVHRLTTSQSESL